MMKFYSGTGCGAYLEAPSQDASHLDKAASQSRKSPRGGQILFGQRALQKGVGRRKYVVAFASALLLSLLLPGFRTATSAPKLRDITVTPSDQSATVTFLFNGPVKTVVVEKKETHLAQIRMRSVAADKKGLTSALLKPGVSSIKAHIEREDVLVTNITFSQKVGEITVLKRDSSKVVVSIELIGPAPNSSSSSAKESVAEKPDASRWSLTTIIIDPGHGGKDPGAISSDGVEEKDVTLAVAKFLKEELASLLPKTKVVLTRSDDKFVELYKRGEIANKNDGRLFISIHCNSMPEKPHPARGFECYILRPGKSEDAARVASRENSAVRYETDSRRYDTIDSESAIMGSLAQSAFARYSESLAEHIRKGMDQGTSFPDRGVHQAGFYVLVGAAMPSVLLELGYLSNEKDAALLRKRGDQKDIAEAIAKGIVSFAKEYAKGVK